MGQKINPISFRSNEKFNLQSNKWFNNINNFNYLILLHQDLEITKLLTDFFYLKSIYIHKILINKFSNNLNINILIYNDKYLDLKFKPIKKINNFINNNYKYKKFLLILLKKNLILNKFYNINLNFINLNQKYKIKLKSLKTITTNTYKQKYKKKTKKKYLINALFKYKNYKDFNKILKLMTVVFTFKSSEILLKFLLTTLKTVQKKKQFQFLQFIKIILNTYFIYYNLTILGLKIQLKGRINSSKRSKKKIIKFGKTPIQTLNINVNYSFNNFVNKDGIFGVRVWFFY